MHPIAKIAYLRYDAMQCAIEVEVERNEVQSLGSLMLHARPLLNACRSRVNAPTYVARTTLRVALQHDQVRERRRSLAAHRPQPYEHPRVFGHHRARLHVVNVPTDGRARLHVVVVVRRSPC